MKKITLNPFDKKSIDDAIKQLTEYKGKLAIKEAKLVERLAHLGATSASLGFSRAIYSGDNDVKVRVELDGNKAIIYADGESVGFIEFGSGAKYGEGHPLNGEFGTGPGTWSMGEEGKGHWNDPKGWWFGDGQHTFGNPPAMAMFNAVNTIAEQIAQIVREVWSSD